MAELIWDAVSVRRGQRAVISHVSLALRPGELVALIGPNGAGKTTLLRAGLGALPLSGGGVRLGGADPRAIAPMQRARLLSYLPQTRPLAWLLKVKTIVALGRFAYGAPVGRLSGPDADAVARALAACRLESLAEREADTLSGGELARVHLARALAAESPLILADEPVAMLDPLHAFETLAILREFCARGGGALVTLHDLGLAARFADRVALLHRGGLLAQGAPAAVLTPALLAEAYGVRAHVSGATVSVEGPA